MQQSRASALGEANGQQNSRTILVIEDDPSLRTALRLSLESAGYHVIEAPDGPSGLEAYDLYLPDLVLLDLMMPGMDGFTTCAHLRELPDGGFVPVLVVTALEDRASIDRAFQMGVTDYITKPVNQDVLRLRVQHLLSATRAEKMILRAKREWEATFDAVSEMLILTDADGTLIRCNRATILRLGTTFRALLGKNLKEVMPALAHLSSADRQGRLGEFEVDGQHGVFEASAYPLALQGGSGIVYVVQDITERKSLQAQMIASQKLADLGTLAAGVAHEINSPLQVITGVSQSLIDRRTQGRLDSERLTRSLEVIHRNGWRCAEIVRSLRTYAYASAVKVEPHSLNDLIQDTLLLIENQLEKVSGIAVVTELGEDIPSVACDRNQISQVLINLLTNAQDSMPHGGQITISSRFEAEEDQVVLAVADTGTGIPAQILSSVFDPFFTTKPLGEGTGLGLSIVDGIVRAHGGEISVSSTEGIGTVFSIRLPGGTRSGSGPSSTQGGRYSR